MNCITSSINVENLLTNVPVDQDNNKKFYNHFLIPRPVIKPKILEKLPP